MIKKGNSMNELQQIGKKIAEIRIKRGFTQEKLAEMVNYSTNHIAKLESARTKPSFNLLIDIAKAMNIEVKDLFDFDEINTIDYMKKDLVNTISNADNDTIKLLYKFKKTLST